SLFVSHHGAVWCAVCDAVLIARLPEDFITAEESQTYPSIACCFNVGPLRPRPIFVVAGRDKNLVILQECTGTVSINTRDVADVVSVRFQEFNQLKFRAEE